MEITNSRDRRILSLGELREILVKYKSYFNKEKYDYLESVLNLETSIFSDEEFSEIFCSLNDIYEIAKYNIAERTRKVLHSSELLNPQRLRYSVNNECASYHYQSSFEGEDDNIKLLEANLRRKSLFTKEEKKPIIKIFGPVDLLSLQYEESIGGTINIDGEIEIMQKELAVTANPKKRHDLENKINVLKLQKESIVRQNEPLKKYLDRRRKILTEVNTLLCKEYKLDCDPLKIDEAYVKKLSWIDIKRAC